MVEVIGNGPGVPGIIPSDCHPDFRHRFAGADLIIVKGQTNYETLGNEPGNLPFLFKVKCPVIADHVNQPVGTQIMVQAKPGGES